MVRDIPVMTTKRVIAADAMETMRRDTAVDVTETTRKVTAVIADTDLYLRDAM